MKQIDSLKIAAHNLWNNKSRTVLTVIIVAVVSTLIMALLLIGIAFSQNQVAVDRMIFDQTGTTYSLRDRTESKSNGTSSSWTSYGITDEEYAQFDELVEKHSKVVGELTVRIGARQGVSEQDYPDFRVLFLYGQPTPTESDFTDSNSWFMYDSNFSVYEAQLSDFRFPPTERELLTGRVWKADDEAERLLWLSDTKIRALASADIPVALGDVVPVAVYLDGNVIVKEYTVAGTYATTATDDDYYSGLSDVGYIIGKQSFLSDFGALCGINSASMRYCPPATPYNFNKVYGEMKSFTEEVNAVMQPSIYNYDGKAEESERFYCAFVDEMAAVMLMSTVIIALVSVLALIVLLLSIGSVANTIIISVDKDRKFIGLMKAVGLNQKGVKRIVTYQSLLQIVAGVLIGVAALFILRPFVLSVMTSLFSSMFGTFGLEYTVTVSVPFYLPIITVVVFFLFAMLFSRSALTKIAKQDVMTTISEVA